MDHVATLETKRTPDRSKEWPEEAKQAAWEIYAGQANRSLRVTERILASDEYGWPVSLRVLNHWRDRYQWDIKLDQASRDIAPTSIGRAILIGATKAPAAMSYLASVVEGTEPPDQKRINAAMAILDRVGIGPIRQVNTLQLPAVASTNTESVDLSKLTSAELEQLLYDRLYKT